MADFHQQRVALNEIRSTQESARLAQLAASEQLKLLQRKREQLDRQKNDNNAFYLERVEQLDATLKKMKNELAEKKERSKQLKAQTEILLTEFSSLTDPRIQLPAHFSNNTPFLLFPTRLETRFKTVIEPQTGRQQPQLWVRIYPDTCMVDSFDPQLSDQEIRNGARFWAEYYAAGDVIDENDPADPALIRQKAAWAFIAKLEGAGRAAWITQADAARPLPGSVFPKRNSDKTVILTIATEDSTVLMSQAAIFNFFRSLWFAGKDQQQIDIVNASVTDSALITEKFLPVNFYDPLPAGLKREDADLQVALVLLPDSLEATGKTNSWSQAAKVSIAPERFILLGFKGSEKVIEQLGKPVIYPLQVGFDPNNTEENNFAPTAEGDLEVPEELLWITDFDEAVRKGMGFRVNLDQSTINGVDRLFVVGLTLSADESESGGQKLLTELFDHHYYSSKGISIVPQGTPTNNSDAVSVSGTGIEDTDLTFDRYFKQKNIFESSADWQKKPDGQWLAEWLGLDADYFSKILNAEGLDQADALNMNLALWPGTLGYAMDAMMKPVFSASAVEMTQRFFSHFVTGRGPVPSIRIGNQPYGILPVTAFGRQQWMYSRQNGEELLGNQSFIRIAQTGYVRKLYELLKKVEADWRKNFVPKVAHVSAENAGSTHQQLLDIIGLHPNSVEFYKRYLQSLDMLYSYASFIFPFNDAKQGFDKMEYGRGYQLLTDLGYEPALNKKEGELPLLSKLYGLEDNWQHKVIIDTVPLSETEPIRSYTAGNANYISALLANAAKSMDALRKNEGLTEKPTALLFSFLRFALEQGYYDTAIRLHEAADIFTAEQSVRLRAEQPYLHMQMEGNMVESRYALLYKNENKISATKSVGDRISELISIRPELRVVSPGLYEQTEALKHLESVPTARLERAFVEHLDCCSYRLDAWQQGLTRLQLTLMRNLRPGTSNGQEQPHRKGIYLGAFGWLENVRPDRSKVLTPVVPEQEIQADFTASYVTDKANAGFIHAPSVNQAVTAAVLRNAYLSNGRQYDNSALAINLSSERIRQALTVIEGIQNGQSLAALLGYKFERMLRDQVNLVNKGIDTFIYALRKIFPLNAERILDTRVESDPSVDPDTIPITAIEAKNVVHGKMLIDHVRKQTGVNKNYPYGFGAAKLPAGDTIIATAITEAVNNIMNIEDAIADLGMAESVHQVCLGNYDRAAGVLDSYSKGNYPQTPDVIRTPRSGPTLTHRIGLPMEYIASVPYNQAEPRRFAEPTLDGWLTGILPPVNDIIAHCRYIDRNDGLPKNDPVSLGDLGLTAIDLLYLLNQTGQAALSDLDERFIHYVYANKNPRLDLDVTLAYTERPVVPNKFSVFEVMSLVGSIRALVLPSVVLKPSDILLPAEASAVTPVNIELDRSRIDTIIADITNILDGDYTTLILDVFNALPAVPTPAEAEAILSQADQYLNAFVLQLNRLANFGLPQTGAGSSYRSRQQIISGIYNKVQEVIDHFIKKQSEYQSLLAAFDPVAGDAVAKLQELEAAISTVYSELDTINLAAITVKKNQFDGKLTALQNLLQPASVTGMFQLLSDARLALSDLSLYTSALFDLQSIETQVLSLVLDDLRPRSQGVFDLAKKAVTAATDALAGYDSLDPQAKVRQLETSARAIFGSEFRLLPRYLLDSQQQFELQNAWNNAGLFDYLLNEHNPVYFDPVEDWLHGAARVREKLHHAENIMMLKESLLPANPAISIHPIQLPFKTENYHWLAMPFPDTYKPEESDVLLYTALTNGAAPVPTYACGLMIDEWTEVIPLEKETTGLTFHYDRPNTEAPQTLLLVTPTTMSGNWQFNDIVDAMHHALDSARLRGVEPFHIDQSVYARYLPPLVSPVTRHPITIGMYLADLKMAAPSS